MVAHACGASVWRAEEGDRFASEGVGRIVTIIITIIMVAVFMP